MIRGPWSWLIPTLVIAGILTPFYPTLDLYISALFYDPETGRFVQSKMLKFAYHYGPWPGNMIALGSFGLILYSYRNEEWKPYRPHLWVVVLTLLLGAGWLVNEVLKANWGRPRPQQIIEFGGLQHYSHWYLPDLFNPNTARSFPSGHASAGWFYLCFIPIGWHLRNRFLVWFGIVSGFMMGGLLSYTRIAQGGHYFSDTMFAALVIWITALALTRFFCGREASV